MIKHDLAEKYRTTKATFFVSTNGDDTYSGTMKESAPERKEGPFATFARARAAVREFVADTNSTGAKDAIIVEFSEGTYEQVEPVKFDAKDSGTPDLPVIYRAASDAEVRLVGGTVVRGFSLVTDEATLSRLDPSARGKVVRANLRDQGIADFGEITSPSWGEGRPGLELFFKGERMTLARWPNEDFVKIESIDVPGNTELKNRVTLSGRMRGSNEGRFIYEGDRPKRWVDEKDPWLHGYWFWDWADQRYRIGSIDTENRVISMVGPKHTFGFRAGQWYYAFNILIELDEPGEWYLDRETGDLFFWPPEQVSGGDVVVSIASQLIMMEETSHVAIIDVTMEAVRGTAVMIKGGEGNLIGGCTIRNTGSWGVRVSGGTGHGVTGCDLSELGEGGIELTGGDRVTLTPGNHIAENNFVHHCSRWNPLYKPGIQLFGAGNCVAHNLLYELPHTAIGFTGNDQIIEYNEIHSAVYMANDAGAIYTSPPTEEFTMYGHIIRYNYVHHLYGFKNRGCNGAIYLDDFFPGTTIYGNIFYDVPRAAFIGGGRYCTIENNVFVDCSPSIHIDARGLGWAAGGEEMLIKLAKEYPYKNELWSSRYPTLVNVLEDEPMVPKGNVVARNICRRGSWDEIEDKARPHVTLEDNLIDADPLFVDEQRLDFRLREDSPAFSMGFKEIPVDDIGLCNDGFRASWPVKHEVREGDVDEPEDKTW